MTQPHPTTHTTHTHCTAPHSLGGPRAAVFGAPTVPAARSASCLPPIACACIWSQASEATALRACFAGLFELTDQAIAAAVAAPELFVLKPQREGGGNNFYGDDIAPTIEAMTAVEKGAYILMQRIFPPKQSGVLLRRGLAITTR